MEKSLKTIYQNIPNNRDLEVTIPGFFNQLVNRYHTYSAVRLALHYYTVYEFYCDEPKMWRNDAKESLQQINQIIASNILKVQSGKELEAAISAMDKIRNEVMGRMKAVMTYTDIFQIYEYVLNRIEYKFAGDALPEDDDEFARDVLRYIFDGEDNMIINEKIRDVIGQLPVRITKQKYFDILKDSLHNYLGAEQSSLDNYLYMLRTTAMLSEEEGMKTDYPQLAQKRDYFTNLDYNAMDKLQYEEAVHTLDQVTLLLEDETSVYFSLQEIINEVYALLLCTPYAGVEPLQSEKQERAAFHIISGIHAQFEAGTWEEPSEELTRQFSAIEGVQEEMVYDLASLEDALFVVHQNHRKLTESMMVDKLLNTLLLCKDLLSNSLFIDFYEIKSDRKVDEALLAEELKKLTTELTQLFEQQDRILNRAVMANTFYKMPVFFNDHKEVMDYIRYSLEKCSDPIEKTACNQIIREMMAD